MRNILFLSLITAALMPAIAAAQTVEFERAKTENFEYIVAGLVPVVLSTPQSKPVTVEFVVIGGTAMRGGPPNPPTDYVLADGVVTFAAGDTRENIAINVVDDAIPEPVEDLIVLLRTPNGALLGTRLVHTYFIFDDDAPEDEDEEEPQPPPQHSEDPPPPDPPPPPPPTPPTIGFATAASTVGEDHGVLQLRVLLSKKSTNSVTVAYRVTGGTASRGDDYTVADGTLSFAPESLVQTIDIAVVNDPNDELDETLQVTLESAQHATLVQPSHAVTILDNDIVKVSFADAASQGGEASTPARIELELSGEPAGAVTVSFVAGGTAAGEAVDYTLPTQVRFEPGQTRAFAAIPIVNDLLVEGDETIALTLVNATNARIGTALQHTYTIRDNDRTLPTVQFASRSETGGEAAPTGRIEIVLDPKFDEPVTVTVARTGGSAGDSDYSFATTVVTFAPDEDRKTITLNIVDDLTEEADETVELTLSAPTNATLGLLPRNTYWILDDDAAPETVSFFRQDVPTADAFRNLVIVAPKTQAILPGGLAVDPAGNVYISNLGTSPGEGSILMAHETAHVTQPRKTTVIKVASNLQSPADIELSKDGRALVVAGTDGSVRQIPFGISVKVTGITNAGPGTRVYALTDRGATPAVGISPDGYFHIPEILGAGQTRDTVDVVIEHNGQTRTHTLVPLGQRTGDGESSPTEPRPVFGQTVIHLEGPVSQ